MADLFTRLAHRARDGGDRVEPRLPARFEPPVVAETPETLEPPPAHLPREVEPGVPTPATHASPTSTAGPRDGDGRPIPSRVEETQVAGPAPVAGPADTVLPVRPRGRAAPSGAEIRRREARQSRTEAADGTARPVVRTTEDHDGLPEPGRIRPLPGAIAPVEAPRRAEVQTMRPSVHISIGRIEVRATQPQASAAPAPAAPIVTAAPTADSGGLTLSAYLRGDDGRPR